MQNIKHRKPRTIQMNYPAPYSQSWANTDPVKIEVDKMKKCASFQSNRNKVNQPSYNCCWQRPKPLTTGCDPYAPHLKYGLFPRKVSLRDHLTKLPMGKTKFTDEEIHKRNMQKFIKEQQKTNKREKQQPASPIVVIRATDTQCARRLSLSKVTHIDIRPQSRSPTLPRALSPLNARLRRRQRAITARC